MDKKNTDEFLRLMNETNDVIAARASEAKIASQVGVDPIREQREADRREKFGQLRARPRPKKKTQHARSAFGGIWLGE